jgi:uncharacterized coiled-coil protein SlyX
MKASIPPVLITFALVFFALVQNTQAVLPPPDGGYPGGNTAEGQNALRSTTTGGYNAAVGYFSLFANTTGSFNTAVGAGALDLNTGDNNTATGAAALLLNTTGANNTATGVGALVHNGTGSHNTANGAFALANATGSFNTAVGDNALFSNTIGTENTANGAFALSANTEGSFNTAAGIGALNMNTTGASNTALGNAAGLSITGDGNVCIGALVIGAAGLNDTTWIRNINTTSQGFIANTNNYVTVRMTDGRLGFSSAGFTTNVSSQRYKEDIKPMDKASETLLALKPVTFRLKGELDPSHRPQWGLIAEEVEKVNPDLVDRNNKGEVESVRYDMVNAMLLNEFLKEHRKVEEQQGMIGRLETTAAKQVAVITELKFTVAQQQKGLQTVTARLDEQAAQIQRVSAQLAAANPFDGGREASKAAPQVVNNDQ